MSAHVPGFQSFFMFLHTFVLAKLATSSTRVKSTLNDTTVLPFWSYYLLGIVQDPKHGYSLQNIYGNDGN